MSIAAQDPDRITDPARKQSAVERLDNVSHWTVEYTTREERPNPVSEAGRYFQRNGSTEVIASDVHRALEILCDAYPDAVVHVVRKTSRFRSILIDRPAAASSSTTESGGE